LSLEVSLGATSLGEGRCKFRVWAPMHQRVEVRIVSPQERIISLEKGEFGYHVGIAERVNPGDRYLYRLDGQKEHPDPASRFQPEGVHGPSEVVDPHFPWEDDTWFGLPFQDYVIYELHVGTFTPAGTFQSIIAHLDELKNLGITAVELMPVAQFPGNRNWGYDGVYPFAVQNSYGGPEGLRVQRETTCGISAPTLPIAIRASGGTPSTSMGLTAMGFDDFLSRMPYIG